ncbi:unnamed protein product [Ambrosiozyma monospora]|uniref:Unnamed protein product n=1 Tax=Ambrosiozyma monospora TaxID=43982 RepID=A0A9W7DJX2_AMBMO|nr:unnamed protein product [Ambrosiozyma monospora]
MMQAANDSTCEVEVDDYSDKIRVSSPATEKPGLTQRLKSLEEEELEPEVELDAGHSSVSSVEHKHDKSIDIKTNPMNDSDELDLDQSNDEKEDESMDETQHLQLPKSGANNNNNIDGKSVTRSSSLGQIMGNFLRSISSKSIIQEDSTDDESTDEYENTVAKNNNNKSTSATNRRSKRTESIRSSGTVGTAVTSTNESDFVSADEGYDSDSDDNFGEPHISLTTASEPSDEDKDEDVSDVVSTETIEHDTYDAASVLGESTQHETGIVRKTTGDLLTEKLAEQKEEEQQQQQPEQELNGKVDKSIDESEIAQPQDSETSSDSFASDKFVLELTDFDDDLYSLS